MAILQVKAWQRTQKKTRYSNSINECKKGDFGKQLDVDASNFSNLWLIH